MHNDVSSFLYLYAISNFVLILATVLVLVNAVVSTYIYQSGIDVY